MILRRTNGSVIFAACRQLIACADALEAELAAMEEGLALTLHLMTESIVLESDCAEAIKLVADGAPNLSRYAMRVSTIKGSIMEREIAITKVSREVNCASHTLATLGKMQDRTEVWLQNYPPEIADAVMADCNIPV
ncbi:hypothetical protein ACQ4PT_022084 [Festuca glaucescens]